MGFIPKVFGVILIFASSGIQKVAICNVSGNSKNDCAKVWGQRLLVHRIGK